MDANRLAAASPGRIRLLPEGLVNRIAAGEVIERPAAAVKELVENALDAGARRVAVALEGGGIDRIEVTDDGAGMDAAELALAVQRHATSKLSDDGLVRIATLGFRGEALPSIGAAARLALVSRPAGAAHAHSIRVEGGAVSSVAPAAGPPGTSAVVRDLFFATPARRAFLKHPRTEAGHAEDAVRRLALAAPGVAFRLESEGRVVFDLPAQDRAVRVAALLGPEADLPVAAARDGVRLAGCAAPPSVTRASSLAQALVVNGRPVADPVLRTAVRVAYRDVIAPGRHAVLALYLDLPAEALDVNVHPAKAELRFRDPAGVRGLVIGALQAALGQGVRAPAAPRAGPGRFGLRLVPPPAPAATGLAEAQLPLGAAAAVRALPAAEGVADQPLGAAVVQLLDTYVVAVGGDGGLVLVDQHAAHERLTHEALRAQALAGGVRSQPLLLPAVVELAPAEAARLLARQAELRALGLELEAFGPGALLVRALPAALGAPDPAPLLRDLADEFSEMEEATALAARLDAVLARLACHGSIRAGRRLSGPEMDALLRRMEATPRAATCSHGRPTVLKLGRAELERLFGRR
ncbi:MAG: DNA mismatch repair endonuclease MutL [Acidisphaera sp.]|nr:DNA mismatch repair endonuclease MutL [Acidisphaera sp.]